MKTMFKAGATMVLNAVLIATPAFAGKKDDTLNIAWDQPLDFADAYFNTSREGILAARMIWDQLIERDPDTFEYKASLATAWRWVDDLTLEFDLRRGVTSALQQPQLTVPLQVIASSQTSTSRSSVRSWRRPAAPPKPRLGARAGGEFECCPKHWA